MTVIDSKASKYQMKTLKRKRLARKLGMPLNTPYPVLWAKEEELAHSVAVAKKSDQKETK